MVAALLRLTFAAVLALAATVAVAQPRETLPPEVQPIFEHWVRATCVGDEQRGLEAQLLRYAVPLAAAFRRAIVAGPPPEELREARAAAEARFAARAKFPLADFKIEGVSDKDIAAFRRVSRQAYVDDQVKRFATGYRANAVAGLAIVGGPEGRATLARLARNASDPLAPVALAALQAPPPR
jgi:hypothetical protein